MKKKEFIIISDRIRRIINKRNSALKVGDLFLGNIYTCQLDGIFFLLKDLGVQYSISYNRDRRFITSFVVRKYNVEWLFD